MKRRLLTLMFVFAFVFCGLAVNEVQAKTSSKNSVSVSKKAKAISNKIKELKPYFTFM